MKSSIHSISCVLLTVFVVLAFTARGIAKLPEDGNEESVQITGTLCLREFTAPHDSENHTDRGRLVSVWILSSRETMQDYQLVILDEWLLAQLPNFLGKRITVAGPVWEGFTVHHHAPYLIEVGQMVEEPLPGPTPDNLFFPKALGSCLLLPLPTGFLYVPVHAAVDAPACCDPLE